MLEIDLKAEQETIKNHRERIRQAECAGEFALSETLRDIIVQEQDHEIDLKDALLATNRTSAGSLTKTKCYPNECHFYYYLSETEPASAASCGSILRDFVTGKLQTVFNSSILMHFMHKSAL
jgi:hypothetical protein